MSDLFEAYERQFHDEKLAAVATQATLDDILSSGRYRRRARTRSIAR